MKPVDLPLAAQASRAAARAAPPELSSVCSLSLAGFHRIAVWQWPASPADMPVLCVHGLTRQGRDFDFLAAQLAGRGKAVACPDLAGRGRSERLRDPLQYNLLQYAADMNAVVARMGCEQVDFVGSSLGGLIGMLMAAQPGSPIRRLVVNDAGPYIPFTALRRIGAYVDTAHRQFADIAQAEAHIRRVLAPYGALGAAQWRHLARHSVRAVPGGFELLHDPSIIRTYRQWQYMSVDLWNLWNRIECPVLALRGAASDFLSPGTLERMTRTGPRARAVEFPGCGHVPSLMLQEQVDPILDFLCAADDALVRTA